MASIDIRALSTGDKSYRVRWRQDGKQQTETFSSNEHAEQFKLDVEAAGNRWPADWIKGTGYAPRPRPRRRDHPDRRRSGGPLSKSPAHARAKVSWQSTEGDDEMQTMNDDATSEVREILEAVWACWERRELGLTTVDAPDEDEIAANSVRNINAWKLDDETFVSYLADEARALTPTSEVALDLAMDDIADTWGREVNEDGARAALLAIAHRWERTADTRPLDDPDAAYVHLLAALVRQHDPDDLSDFEEDLDSRVSRDNLINLAVQAHDARERSPQAYAEFLTAHRTEAALSTVEADGGNQFVKLVGPDFMSEWSGSKGTTTDDGAPN